MGSKTCLYCDLCDGVEMVSGVEGDSVRGWEEGGGCHGYNPLTVVAGVEDEGNSSEEELAYWEGGKGAGP